jgi:hypothetical protein
MAAILNRDADDLKVGRVKNLSGMMPRKMKRSILEVIGLWLQGNLCFLLYLASFCIIGSLMQSKAGQ